jgi:hypothetical protein
MKPKCTLNHKEIPPSKLILKMGGLICPKCRKIIYAPYVDKEFKIEFQRRAKLFKKDI